MPVVHHDQQFSPVDTRGPATLTPAERQAHQAWNAAGGTARIRGRREVWESRVKTPRPEEIEARQRHAAQRATVDPMVAPKDYEQLFKDWYDYTVALVTQLGIVSADAPDVSNEIILRFMERGFIDQFDPTREMEHRGRVYKARWQSYWSNFVEHYVRGLRDRQTRRRRHEALICDAPLPDGTLWLRAWAQSGRSYDDDYSQIEESDRIRAIRDFVWRQPVRGARHLGRLFDAICLDTMETGSTRTDRAALAARFDVSESTIGVMLRELRVQVRVAVAALDVA